MPDENPSSEHSGEATDVADETAVDASHNRVTSGNEAVRSVVNEKPTPPTRRRTRVSARGMVTVVNRIRGWIASAVWIIAVVCAVILAIGALLVALEWANENNSIVNWFQDSADWLAGPIGQVFEFDSESKNALVNWGLAAVIYLVAGQIAQRIIRP